MSEIDLIPQKFRHSISRMREVKLALLSIVVFAVCAVVIGWSLNFWVTKMDDEHSHLMKKHALSTQQSDELTRLSDQRNELLNQRSTLTVLRGGGAATDLMLVIDRALPTDDVWFKKWSFHRRGDDENSVFSGSASDSSEEFTTLMNISGQSIDHAALSKFVRALYEQSEVVKVKLRRTTVRRYPTHKLIDFELFVLMKAKS